MPSILTPLGRRVCRLAYPLNCLISSAPLDSVVPSLQIPIAHGVLLVQFSDDNIRTSFNTLYPVRDRSSPFLRRMICAQASLVIPERSVRGM